MPMEVEGGVRDRGLGSEARGRGSGGRNLLDNDDLIYLIFDI